MPKMYSLDLKREILIELLETEDAQALSEKYGVSVRTLYRWQAEQFEKIDRHKEEEAAARTQAKRDAVGGVDVEWLRSHLRTQVELLTKLLESGGSLREVYYGTLALSKLMDQVRWIGEVMTDTGQNEKRR